MRIFALPIGFIIDFFLGDPYSLPHPVRLIGSFISRLEKALRKSLPKKERLAGAVMVLTVLFFSTAIPWAILFFLYETNKFLGLAAESVMCYYLLAARCLEKESMKVCRALEAGDLKKARSAVSMIVGRDTDKLDAEGIIRAAIESVAENTVDGVTAPIIFIALGGAPLGFLYKAANTMDSMVGYKNEKYINFGRFAARLDDFLNFIPSRLTAVIMIFAAYIMGLDGKNAYKIWKRDRLKHPSPNSAQTEAAAAGALRAALGGDASYFGKIHKKPVIGDDLRKLAPDDIRKADRLMYMTAVLTLVFVVLVRLFMGAAA